MQTSKLLLYIILAASVVGFADASYLAAKYYSGSAVECAILAGCAQVTTSQYAEIAGVSIALIGAIYYFLLFVLGVLFREKSDARFLAAIAALSSLGFLVSIWFTYLQVAVIKALCVYCLTSAASTTAIFVSSLFLVKMRQKPPGPVDNLASPGVYNKSA